MTIYASVGVMVPLKSSPSHFSMSTTTMFIIGPFPRFSKAFSLSGLFFVASDIPDAIECVHCILLWSFSVGEYPVGLSMFKFLFIYSFLLVSYSRKKELSRQFLRLNVASFYVDQLILPVLEIFDCGTPLFHTHVRLRMLCT